MTKLKTFKISSALSNGLEETIRSAENYPGDLRIEPISLNKIEVDPKNPRELLITTTDISNGIDPDDMHFQRKTEERKKLKSIADTITTQGILQPIIVYRHEAKYRIVVGERRFLASILAHRQDIPARILEDKPNDFDLRFMQWIENHERENLTLEERLINLEQLIDAHTKQVNRSSDSITATDISNIIKCSLAQAASYKAVLDGDPVIRGHIRENKINSLEKAYILIGITSPELRANAIQACLQGASFKELKEISKLANTRTVLKARREIKKNRVINFGYTSNPEVAKIIMKGLIENHTYLKELKSDFDRLKWGHLKSVTAMFRKILSKIEEQI